jgi:hypothetical protein
MSPERVHIRELAGWGLDISEYRPRTLDSEKLDRARHIISERVLQSTSALLELETAGLQDYFSRHAVRSDLEVEMEGLEWSFGVVDLRLLLAFQRRLVFNSSVPDIVVPAQEDWPSLVDLAFGPAKTAVYDLTRCAETSSIILRSNDPNLHLRISDDPSAPITVHAGSPFFEVAFYRCRWFLRDGYHRAFALLQAGVFRFPAVIVQARTLDELGAVRPWFFSEETLFSSSPPHVIDFLNDALTIDYDRLSLIKTLRVTMEETFEPAIQGDRLL